MSDIAELERHEPRLITSFIERQFECSCGFRTRVCDGLSISIFDIEDEMRRHLDAVEVDAKKAKAVS